MELKNKTLIPLIIIFFILGIAVGYMTHKPVIIEKPVEVEKIVTVTVTVIPTPTQTTSTPTPTPTPIAIPTVSDFTVKDYYNPDTDIPCNGCIVTIERNYNINPSTLSVHPGQSVLIRITPQTLPYSLTLILNNSYQKDLGAGGAAFVTFNKKGTYPFKSVIPSGDPTILPKPYADGTIIVY